MYFSFAMDILWLIVSILLIVTGIVGCLLPFLPGPPLSYLGLLIMQLREDPPFSTRFLLIWAGVTIVITILDYVIPVYSTRKFGGTKWGVWGCTIGLIAGIFFPPWGLIVGPFLGALLGELMGNANSNNALNAAIGSFVGFLFGTLLKIIACCLMLYYTIAAAI